MTTVPKYIAQVTVYCEGCFCRPGEPAPYTGPPNWKYAPIDPVEYAEWELNVADPDRVADENVGGIQPPPRRVQE